MRLLIAGLVVRVHPGEYYYYGARYYDGKTGRFTGKDLIDGEIAEHLTLNKYIYVLNNSNKWIDRWGLCKSGSGDFWDTFWDAVVGALQGMADAITGFSGFGLANVINEAATTVPAILQENREKYDEWNRNFPGEPNPWADLPKLKGGGSGYRPTEPPIYFE